MVLFGTMMYQKAYVLSCILLGIASGRCGWLMHEAGHNSLTGDVVTDKWLQTFFYGAGCGMSASWWRSQHNRHHASPQPARGRGARGVRGRAPRHHGE